MEQKFYLEKYPDGTWRNFQGLLDALGGLQSGRWMCTITRYKKKRSLDQNAFYWSIFLQYEIDCFKEFWGETYSKQAVHDWNKANFWGEEKVIEATGEIIKSPGSSADKSTVEFEVKLEEIRQWFRQNFEWEIPKPNTQSEMF